MLSSLASGEWIQNRRRNRSFAVIWGLLGVGIAITGAAFVVLALGNNQIEGAFVLLAVFLPLALYAGWYAVGSARAGLMVTHEAVSIRNPFRTRVIPIASVMHFTEGLQPAQKGNATPGILVEVKDGRTYSVWTLAREGLVWNSASNVARWDGVADSLNNLVDSVR